MESPRLQMKQLLKQRADAFLAIHTLIVKTCNDRGHWSFNNIGQGTVWNCSESPVGICVYNDLDDEHHDQCLYCGAPEERK